LPGNEVNRYPALGNPHFGASIFLQAAKETS
jgi:hypothetical protein